MADGRLMQETIQYRHDSHFILSEWRKEHNHKGPFKKYVRPNILTFDPPPNRHTRTHTYLLGMSRLAGIHKLESCSCS